MKKLFAAGLLSLAAAVPAMAEDLPGWDYLMTDSNGTYIFVRPIVRGNNRVTLEHKWVNAQKTAYYNDSYDCKTGSRFNDGALEKVVNNGDWAAQSYEYACKPMNF
jgi:hypothetical protein